MAQLTPEQALQLALRHHQAGRLAQAEPLYRQILGQQPNNAEALHHLGLIAHQVGKNEPAVELISRAVAINPADAGARSNLGVALKELGRLDEAIAAYRHAIALRPSYPEAFNNLGIALMEMGQVDEAITAYRRAIALNPGSPQAYSNLGIALKDKEEIDDAIAAFRRAIAANPNYAQAYSNLGGALTDQKKFDEAIAACRRAISLRPDYAEAFHNLANALQAAAQLDEALVASRQAIALNPKVPEAYNTLGLIFGDKEQFDEAIAAYHQALALRPNYAEAHRNIGNALHDSGKLGEAIAAFRKAIALNPDFAEAHKNLSFTLRMLGEFAEGWEEYEWRWKSKDFTSPDRNFSQPLWDGRPLAGATLLLHAEQGFGDTIQFIRYLPMIDRQGGKIVVECAGELEGLLKPFVGDCHFVARGQPLPDFDMHCPLMSLPRIFKTTLETIPAAAPYLFPDHELLESWRRKLGDSTTGRRIALAWAGNPNFKGDRKRSMSIDRLAPLAGVSGVTFHSIQKGGAAAEAQNPPAGLRLVNLSPDLHGFADTAAVMCLMDLVITTDTSVAHLAGALGRPVWVMLQFVPDWRWLLEREDNPWYPTMRLFRQPKLGDWESVMKLVAAALIEQ